MRIYYKIGVFVCFSEKNFVVYHDQGHDQGHDQDHDHDQGHDQGHNQGGSGPGTWPALDYDHDLDHDLEHDLDHDEEISATSSFPVVLEAVHGQQPKPIVEKLPHLLSFLILVPNRFGLKSEP